MSPERGPFRVEVVEDYSAALDELRAVREAVFVREQQVPLDLEWDKLDPFSRHVIARDAAGIAIGTGRLTPERKIGRMAVLPEWRNAGVGAALLQALLRLAREHGWHDVSLHAQVGALDFYLRHGFVAYGPRFSEAGIEHQAMRRSFDRPQAVIDREAAVAIATQLITNAHRRLWIYSRELDPGLLDDPRVLEALRGFATRGQGNEVQLLLQDAAAPQRAHAPLLALAQRLPSAFAFREVDDPVDRAYAAAFIANDAGGYYFRGLGHRFDGEAEADGSGRARQLAETFKPVWERSRPCTELRALGL
jgi:predicted GNAT family N-acyltransferase